VPHLDLTKDTIVDRLEERLPGYMRNPPARQRIEEDGKPVVGGDILRKLF